MRDMLYLQSYKDAQAVNVSIPPSAVNVMIT